MHSSLCRHFRYEVEGMGPPGSARLGLALSDGSIGILGPSQEGSCLGPLHSLVIEADTLATCVDFNARDESALAVSLASGQLGLVQVCSCGCVRFWML